MSLSDPRFSYDDVRLNYNQLGTAIIEEMYGVEGYLSPGGEDATDHLAALTRITQATRVLDVGSGLGGPAFRLADRYGCQITGLELIELNVQKARERSTARDVLHRVEFYTGDATATPFPADVFTLVWSQDAWCHVPDRDAVIGECARVLEPGGAIAFSDWLLTGQEDLAFRRDLLPALACPGLETLSGYRALLERHGFTDIQAIDMSARYAGQYRQVMVKLQETEDQITTRFGAKVYRIVMDKNTCIETAFDKRQIGGGQFVARLAG